MLLKYLTGLSVTGLLFSCKSISQDSAFLDNGQSGVAKRPSSPLIVFNWSSGSGALEEHLSIQIDQAAKMNRELANGVKKFPPLAKQGMGLYVANDPILSSGYGNELSCLELKENTEILMAKDPILSDLDPMVAVKQSEPVLIYRYGDGLIPSQEGGSSSGVIRDRSVIDFRRSRKFDLSGSNLPKRNPRAIGEQIATSTLKFDEGALRRADSALSSGRFCEALQVFENKSALFYSAIASVKAIRQSPKNEKLIKTPTSKLLLTVLYSQYSDQVNSIINDKGPYLKIRQDLIDKKLVEKEEMDGNIQENVSLTMLISEFLFVNEQESWSAEKILVLTQLVNMFKILVLPEGITTTKELSAKIIEALDMKIANWTKENPRDFEFSKKLWSHWNEHSIASFISKK